MNEQNAIYILAQRRYAANLCVPRYTPRGWWECDLFEVTATGFFREYEVKLTVADFKADAKKVSQRFLGYDEAGSGYKRQYADERKHDFLVQASSRGPSRFWYVTPERLLKPEMLPSWAGLIELWTHTRRTVSGAPCGDYVREHEIVKAPQLHREKIDPKITEHARGVCYYRMHDLMQRQHKARQQTADRTALEGPSV